MCVKVYLGFNSVGIFRVISDFFGLQFYTHSRADMPGIPYSLLQSRTDVRSLESRASTPTSRLRQSSGIKVGAARVFERTVGAGFFSPPKPWAKDGSRDWNYTISRSRQSSGIKVGAAQVFEKTVGAGLSRDSVCTTTRLRESSGIKVGAAQGSDKYVEQASCLFWTQAGRLCYLLTVELRNQYRSCTGLLEKCRSNFSRDHHELRMNRNETISNLYAAEQGCSCPTI